MPKTTVIKPVHIVWQKHHCIYPSDKNKEVTRRVRKGWHQVLTLVKRFKHLYPEEINAMTIEMELRRFFPDEKDM